MQAGKWIAAILLVWTVSWPVSAADLKGKISITDDWRPVIYLSQINEFNDLNTASYHLLIAEAEIDQAGVFSFDALNIPAYDQIYRLHICKTDDPVSTIIIGGREQNHLHFLMNASSEMTIDIRSFNDFTVQGHPGNKTLQELFDLKRRLHSPLDIPSDQNRKLHKENIKEKFIAIAETEPSIVNRMLALYFLHQSFDIEEYDHLFEPLTKAMSNFEEDSPYFRSFYEQVQILNYNKREGAASSGRSPKFYYWLIAMILGYALFRLVYSKLKKRRNDPAQMLSIQEKKVFELLREGKSNKEISSELHIEVSTVKSHVYKIFSKLGIKSRKELIS